MLPSTPPPGDRPGRLRRRWAPGVLALGLGLAAFWPRPGDSQAPAETTAAPAGEAVAGTSTVGTAAPGTVGATPALESREAGCPTCAAMAARLPAGEFAKDPHTFACRTCHHPHVQKTPDDWRQRCTTPDCHPRPWPRTVFHRVQPEVFLNCLNCHRPHTWALDGQNCLGCHAAQLDTLGTVTGGPGHDYGAFSHEIHRKVDCRKCHDLSRKHAITLVQSKADCEACHHGPDIGVTCRTCHGGATAPAGQTPQAAAAPGQARMAMDLSVWKEPKTRAVTFSHERHAKVECRNCHQGTEAKPAATLCATCHQSHHRPQAECVTCHRPPARKAHSLSVHVSGCAGSGCHQDPPFARVVPARNFCMTCHQDKADHNPGKNCAGCHKIAPGRP